VKPRATQQTPGFTLIELLVVIAIIGVLASIMAAASVATLGKAREASCTATLRGIFTANFRYALDHEHFVPAGADMLGNNNQRWHGVRSSSNVDFDGYRGPMVDYLPGQRALRECPSFRPDENAPNTFEKSCGGYGYNIRGVGSRAYELGMSAHALQRGMAIEDIAEPSSTVMFTDAAFGQPYGAPEFLIEYSFAEAYQFVNGDGQPFGKATPSIHFRHNKRANVIWCDGHISHEEMTVEDSPEQTALKLGWFGEANNDLFDNK